MYCPNTWQCLIELLFLFIKDIAIGAPYEDDQRGAVYIYNGYRQGVWPYFSQRIRAADLGPNLKGFGISITTGMDLNNDAIRGMQVYYVCKVLIVLM